MRTIIFLIMILIIVNNTKDFNNYKYHNKKYNSPHQKNSPKKHKFLSILEAASNVNSRAMHKMNIVFKQP
jgi:hypothetical protein